MDTREQIENLMRLLNNLGYEEREARKKVIAKLLVLLEV